LRADTKSLLVCATSDSRILLLDVKTMQVSSKLSAGRYLGPFTCLALDQKKLWVVVGTAYGFLLLFDLRFGLLLKTIDTNHSSQTEQRRRIANCSVHLSKGKGRWIVISAEAMNSSQAALEVWDLGTGQLVEQFRLEQAVKLGHSRQNSQASLAPGLSVSMASSTVELSAAAAIEKLLLATSDQAQPQPHLAASQESEAIGTFVLGLDYAQSHLSSSRRLASQPNPSSAPFSSGELVAHPSDHSSYMLTGGQDLKLRFWDLDNIEKSLLISTPDESKSASYTSSSSQVPGQPTQYVEQAIGQDTQRHRSTLIASYQHALLKAHQDAITAIAVLQLPFKCVVSGDRRGVIKITS
jgi:phosphoinositide-3-kinase regulatory subunit 4